MLNALTSRHALHAAFAAATLLLIVLMAPASEARAIPAGSAGGGVHIGISSQRDLGQARACRTPARAAGKRRRTVRRVKPCQRHQATASIDPSSLYWGAWIGKQFTGQEAPWDMNAASSLEAAVRKPMSMIQFAAPFADCPRAPCSFYEFPDASMENIRKHGAIPFFSWSSQSTPSSLNEPNFQLSDVINGTYDSYIREFATEAASWGHPFFLRFDWEMNGNWFPWSEGVNGNQPGEYVAAWRHVHDIFTSVGATNVTWVWCANVDPTNKFQELASLYPGDNYVDWTSLDGYNWGTDPVKPSGWIGFNKLFSSTYHSIVDTIAPSKPMVIGEVGSTEYGGSKAAWITEMLNDLPTEFPRIHGLLWFDKYEESMDWPLDSSASATAAFASGIQSPSYLGADYASLGPGPIQPPS
jgi:hypothetical protein